MYRTRKNGLGTLLFFTCASALVISSCTKGPKPEASAYGWTTNENQRATLSDYKGKVVVLDFYATWCEPCRAETPHLVQMQRRYEGQGLQVIGLNVGGEDDHTQVPDYAKQFDVPYPLAIPDDELVDEYLTNNQNIPQAFVFDRSGQIVKRFVGYSEQSGQELESIVQASLAAGQ